MPAAVMTAIGNPRFIVTKVWTLFLGSPHHTNVPSVLKLQEFYLGFWVDFLLWVSPWMYIYL